MHSYQVDLCETHVAFRTEADPDRVEKDVCTYCGQRPGFDYEVVKRHQ